MKIIYEFEPDHENNNDQYELKLVQNASNMASALSSLDDLRRALYKGYKYYPSKEEITEEEMENRYSRIEVDSLIEDLGEILIDSKYYDFL